MSCPDPVLLSRLLDDELAEPDATPVRAHVATCAVCHDRLARLAQVTIAVRSPLPAPARGPSAGCLTPEQVAGWVQHALAGAELQAVDEHLRGCDACLDEGLAAARMMATLAAGPTAAVPDTLRARVASRWADAPAAPSLTAVVVGIARAGARLLERHLVAPVLAVDPLPSPVPAVRAGDVAETVRFRIRAPGAQIHAAVVPAGDVVGLTLTLLGDAEEPLAGQRVFVRRQGRSVFSARTDAAGELRVQRIEPGVYEVSCPGIGTDFRLDLRP